MAYTFTTNFGNGVILAPCLQTLCAEIAHKYPNAVNLGEIGDTSHQAEGFGSDHNPFIRRNGTRYVRAIDIGGDASIQQGLFNFVQHLYDKRDPRVYPFGYVHKDGVITTWFGPGTHSDPGDDGHLHISVTQEDGKNPEPGRLGAGAGLARAMGTGERSRPAGRGSRRLARTAVAAAARPLLRPDHRTGPVARRVLPQRTPTDQADTATTAGIGLRAEDPVVGRRHVRPADPRRRREVATRQVGKADHALRRSLVRRLAAIARITGNFARPIQRPIQTAYHRTHPPSPHNVGNCKFPRKSR